MKLSLRNRLLVYMQKRHTEWVASGDLQRLVAKYTDYTPRTVVRRLEEMVEDGKLEVELRKGHAWYRVSQGEKSTPTPLKPVVQPDGSVRFVAPSQRPEIALGAKLAS